MFEEPRDSGMTCTDRYFPPVPYYYYLFNDKRAILEKGTPIEQLGIRNVQPTLCGTPIRTIERIGISFQWLGISISIPIHSPIVYLCFQLGERHRCLLYRSIVR